MPTGGGGGVGGGEEGRGGGGEGRGGEQGRGERSPNGSGFIACRILGEVGGETLGVRGSTNLRVLILIFGNVNLDFLEAEFLIFKWARDCTNQQAFQPFYTYSLQLIGRGHISGNTCNYVPTTLCSSVFIM